MSRFVRKLSYLMLLLSLAIANGGGCNIYSEFSDKDSDNAKIDDAKIAIDKGNWTLAIAKIGTISSPRRLHRDIQALAASAYAGRCGLNILNLISSLSGAPASTTFMQTLLTAMRGATVTKLNDCVTAETILKTGIGSADVRNPEENVLMAMISMAKLGVLLAVDADSVDGDGSVDAGFDNCSNAAAPVGIIDAHANEGVTALGNMLSSITAAGATISGSPAETFTQLCDALSQPPLDPSFARVCSVTDVASVTAQDRSVYKTLVGTQSPIPIGLVIAGAPQPEPPVPAFCP